MFFSFSICFGVIAALCCSSPFLFFASPFRNWAVPYASVSEILFSIPYLFVSVPADLLLFLSVLSVTKPYHFFSNLCLSFPSQLHSVLNISAPQPFVSLLFHCISVQYFSFPFRIVTYLYSIVMVPASLMFSSPECPASFLLHLPDFLLCRENNLCQIRISLALPFLSSQLSFSLSHSCTHFLSVLYSPLKGGIK